MIMYSQYHHARNSRERDVVLHQLKPGAASARLLFAALVVLSGVGVHLISELFGLGLRADAALIVSARHVPLGLVTLAALVALGAAGCAIAGHPNRKAAVADMMRSLPGGGRGLRFLTVAFTGELFTFALTEGIEGAPIDRGDFGLAILAALVASVIVALLLSWSQRRLIACLGELLVLLTGAALPAAAQSWKHVGAQARIRRCRSIVFAGSRRPPPSALLI
jgi:hypothetical protein